MTDLSTLLATGAFDFLDFGCSKGDSLRYGMKRFGGQRGLGLDIDPNKVRRAIEAGFDACETDVRSLKEQPNCVRFVLMSHFLEHLDGFRQARACITAACAAAREFVFIQQPWFDSDGYLFRLGLKLYWSERSAHTYAMSALDFHRVLSRIDHVRTNWRLYAARRIANSYDAAVHSLGSPQNQHDFDAAQHPPKPRVVFDQPVYREIRCLIKLSDSVDMDDLERRFEWQHRLFSGVDPSEEDLATLRAKAASPHESIRDAHGDGQEV